MTMVFGWLNKAAGWMLKNPVIVLLAVFATMFAITVAGKNKEISILNRESDYKNSRIENLFLAVAQERTNVANLRGALEQQNAGIALLAVKADEASTQFDEAMVIISAKDSTFAERVKELRAAKPGPDKCASASSLIRSLEQ